MPVPRGSTRVPPRRLLRDVVLEQLLEAIQGGVLAPGEVLKVDQLADWLKVSRTPVREAIGRLVEMGLVETAPNSYTRVVEPDLTQLEDALRVLYGLYEIAARQGLPALAGHERVEAASRLRFASAGYTDRAHAADRHWYDFLMLLILASDNQILERLVMEVQALVVFLLRFRADHYQFTEMAGITAAMADATEAGDLDALLDLLGQLADSTTERFLRSAREAGE